MGGARTRYTSAPESIATVAPFRAWRGLRLLVAREPMQAPLTQSGYLKLGLVYLHTIPSI